MMWMRNRFLLLTYAAALAVLAAIGCTSREDPSEVMDLCGNHTCGELVMATTDTSSEGFVYLEPALSPDGSRILFTADWWALPTRPRYDGDEDFVNHRQVVIVPLSPIPPDELQPTTGLGDQNAVLVWLEEFGLSNVGGVSATYSDAQDRDKGGPLWETDTSIIFWLGLGVGNRLFRGDITDPANTTVEVLYMEESDAPPSPPFWHHMEPALSPDGNWLAFTRSGCTLPDSFETCSGLSIWALDMSTAGDDEGYGAVAFPLTNEYSRVEAPSWSPDGTKLIFSGGMDVAGGVGAGTELFTIDFDPADLDLSAPLLDRNPFLDRNLTRLTFTRLEPGDPISGVFNTSPVYSNDMGTVYFVSTRRAPSITLHDRNIWYIPANGSLDPQIYFFTRSDDVDPSINPDGTLLLSSALGFPTEMLNRLEQEAYERYVEANETAENPLDEVQLRARAAIERNQLEFFEGVMSHLYLYRP